MGVDATPSLQQVFFGFSQDWGKLLFQTSFLAVGPFLGHLSMKNFSDWTYSLCCKIRQREDVGGGNHPSTNEQKLAYFLTMKMTFNIDKI